MTTGRRADTNNVSTPQSRSCDFFLLIKKLFPLSIRLHAHAAGGIGTGSSSLSLPHTELAGMPLFPFFVGVPSPLASR